MTGVQAMPARSEEPRVSTDTEQLPDAESFHSIEQPGGLISIVGFGSLLSERSARFTFPELRNFREGRIHGFRRVFAHVAPVFLERGIANIDTREMSSLSVEPWSDEGASIVVSVFEIDVSEAPAFIEREHEFRFLAVTPTAADGQLFEHRAVMCSRYSDEEYRRDRCGGSAEEYQKRYGRWGIEKIWVDDVFPCRVYLRHCVLASERLSKAAHQSFLDGTFLADRVTTIRSYLRDNATIMEDLPPPALRERYGG